MGKDLHNLQQTFKQGRIFGRAIKVQPKKEKRQHLTTTDDNKTGLNRITQSMVKDYLRCPKLFYYRYILGIRLPMKNIELVFGSAIHKAVEYFYDNKDSHSGFKQEFKKELIEPFDEKEYRWHQKEGSRLLDEFVSSIEETERYYQISRKGTSEVPFRTWWRDPFSGTLLPTPVSGRYDRVADDGQILEIKTSSKPYRQNDIDVALQADMYMFSQYMLTKKIPASFFYIVFIKGRKKDPIQVLKTERTKEDFSRIFQTVDLILKNIKGGQFDEGTGFMHKFCECKKYKESLLLNV